MTVLVDSNVILDILTNDPNWFDWSALQLTTYAGQDQLAINPIIYAEIAVGFPREQELITALPFLFNNQNKDVSCQKSRSCSYKTNYSLLLD